MHTRFLLPLILLCTCLMLFGCSKAPSDQTRDFTKPTQGADATTEGTTEATTEVLVEANLPLDGYYLYPDQTELYLYLQGQKGKLYFMNLPVEVTLQDGKIYANGQNGVEYTYKNNEISFSLSGAEFTLKYMGEELEDAYKPIVPPAGTYAVSSVGENGNVQFYSQVTEEVLTLSQDGTGSFFFAGQQYDILLQGSTLTVNGEPIGFFYTVLSEEEAMLMFLWPNEGADSIVLRPIMVP